MPDTVFKETHFSDASQDLYNQVISDDSVHMQLGIIEAHNEPTAVHSRGVAQLVSEFVTSGGFDLGGSSPESVVRAALLHDLGKVSISNSILTKPTGLTHREWRQVEKHSADGFHRYANEFDAYEALPILGHHTMQIRDYPDRDERERAAAKYGIPARELDDKDVLTSSLLISVADQMEARYPFSWHKDNSISIRAYEHRGYTVSDLPSLVESSFVEAGKIRKMNLGLLLIAVIELSQIILLME